MLNIEKYKDEIKAEIEKDNTLGCVVNKLMGNTCNYYPKCNDCYLKVLDWLLQEYQEPILTDEEKEYLSAVIKPFKNSIQYIGKFKLDDGFQQIRINYEGEHYASIIELPPFDNDMYKGMGIGKFYSLEVLGLC